LIFNSDQPSTSFSGIAWAHSTNPRSTLYSRDIHVISDWSGGKGDAKVPSQIWYLEDGSGQYLCGNEIPDGVEPLKWFKLLQAKEEDLPRHMTEAGDFDKIEEAQYRLNAIGKRIEDVVADYLRFLWIHVLAAIERAKTRPVLNTTAFHVVLTFPAIWQADAMQKMRVAVQKAGILDRRRAGTTVFDLVPEPEAAALATYADILNEVEHARDGSYQEGQFQSGETFVVLDAGGGTCVSELSIEKDGIG
jgi:hypothetical protein